MQPLPQHRAAAAPRGRLLEPLVPVAQKGRQLGGLPRTHLGAADRSQPGRSSLFLGAGKEKLLISPGKHSRAVPQLPGPNFRYKCQVHLSDTLD